MALKPLSLKEHLMLDSSQSAPQNKPAGATLRCLLEAELRSDEFAASSHSITSVMIKAVNVLQFFSTQSGNLAYSFLQESFVKKLRCGFWKRNVGKKEREFRLFSPSFGGVSESFGLASGDNQETNKENCGKKMNCPLEEEKEQFSPVSVMEFPYNGELQQFSTSSCSRQNLTGNYQTKNHRFEEFVNRVELHPVDLNHQFTDFDSTVHVAYTAEEERRRKAISLLHEFAGGENIPASEEKLLFEFFVKGLALSEHGRNWKREYSGDVVVGEMERRGWKLFEDCRDMVVEEMSGSLVTWLMEELVGELSAVCG